MTEQTRPYRRLIAVLFADIVGFTRLSSSDGPAALQIVEQFESAVRQAAAACEGTVVKFLGDGAMVRFPSTEAAVRAALLLRKAFAQSAAGAAALRIGVHVGDVLIRQDADLLGDGVNVAARVQSAAAPDQVTVSEEAWKHLRHLPEFQFRFLGNRQLKGVPERTRIYAVDFADTASDQTEPVRWQPVRPRWLVAGLLAALLVIAAILWPRPSGEHGFEPVDGLVVLPFDNLTGSQDQDYLISGMHDALIGALTEIDSLRVISRTSAIRYRDTRRPLSEIARELNVDAVLAASVLRSGDDLRIRAELVRVLPSEESLWAGTFDRELRDVLALYSDIALTIADAVQVQLQPHDRARMRDNREVDPEAYKAYLRGRLHWDRHTASELDLALRQFQRALEIDPDYAPAHAGIASVWHGRRQLGVATPEQASREARAAAQRALELDPDLAHAHHALAVELGWYDWDWEGAERHFRRALELSPGDGITRAFLAMMLRITGRFDEAVQASEQARALDPFNPIVNTIALNNLIYVGRMDEALAGFSEQVQDTPNHPIVATDYSVQLHLAGRHDESLAVLADLLAAQGEGELAGRLKQTNRQSGYFSAMREMAETLVQQSANDFVPPTRIAGFYLRSGNNAEALAWLLRGLEERDANLAFLRSPLYDPLRDEPQFQELFRRVNL